MVILDLWGMVFHAMVVIAPIYILLLESIWACCGSNPGSIPTQELSKSVLDFFQEVSGFLHPLNNDVSKYGNSFAKYFCSIKNPCWPLRII